MSVAVAELVDYWTRTVTPIQAASQIAAYAFIGLMGGVGGWTLKNIRKSQEEKK